MRTSRFQPFAPTTLKTSGLRRLRTAFSPSSSVSSSRSFRFGSGSSTPRRSPSASSSTGTASPLSSHMGSPAINNDCETMEGLVIVPTTSYPIDGLVMGDCLPAKPQSTQIVTTVIAQKAPSPTPRGRLRAVLMRRRRQQSTWDITLEEEQKSFGPGLRVFEPRQKGEIAMGGIFEVLEGKW